MRGGYVYRNKKAFSTRCRYSGCPSLTTHESGYCGEHVRLWSKPYRVRQQRQSDPLYNDARWKTYSKWFRTQHPLCINYSVCGGIAELVDHIAAVEQGGEFWNTDNHQSMCKACHATKRSYERRDIKQVGQ